LDAGIRLVFSSDWRISPQRPDGLDMDPLAGMFGAAMRQSPLGGRTWQPEQRITVAEALATYTTAAAEVSGASGQRGAIASGMDADLVVLSRDILAEGASALLATRVLLTIVGGRIVFGTGGGGDGNP
jgi:predicted amidohydrolase YtcJ